MAIDTHYICDLFDLKQRVVVLTGGIGKLGTNFAEALVRANARVAIFDVVETPNERLAELAKSFPLLFLKVDVTNEAEVSAAVETVTKTWETPTGLINNAGWKASPNESTRASAPFEDYPMDVWNDVFRINTLSAAICSKIVGKGMIRHGQGGTILNIISHYALVSPDQRVYAHREAQTGRKFVKDPSYGASKAALLALTRDLATQWAPHGIRVVGLSPGGVLNPKGDPEFIKNYTQRTPLARMANEDEYNRAILFLMTDTYSTGSNLIVDGGYTAW
jgi:NAD(P)-dependent dehydrogenase (short-subunit alcohol dehydrogenase family)